MVEVWWCAACSVFLERLQVWWWPYPDKGTAELCSNWLDDQTVRLSSPPRMLWMLCQGLCVAYKPRWEWNVKVPHTTCVVILGLDQTRASRFLRPGSLFFGLVQLSQTESLRVSTWYWKGLLLVGCMFSYCGDFNFRQVGGSCRCQAIGNFSHGSQWLPIANPGCQVVGFTCDSEWLKWVSPLTFNIFTMREFHNRIEVHHSSCNVLCVRVTAGQGFASASELLWRLGVVTLSPATANSMVFSSLFHFKFFSASSVFRFKFFSTFVHAAMRCVADRAKNWRLAVFCLLL